MDGETRAFILATTGAEALGEAKRIQSLWAGYGEIVRVALRGAETGSVVLKRVAPPAPPAPDSPEGRSHARKLRSYQVERAFYATHAARCDDGCRVPALLGHAAVGDRLLFLLEDLDAQGFAARRSRPSPDELDRCLAWLARFHATFLGTSPEGLWEAGTYWHLATRPDELGAMDDDDLRRAAPALDAALRACPYQTLLHGDAKLANFCFDPGRGRVAAVDFQYVGGGPGIVDVAYLLSSALPDAALEASGARWLDAYETHLRAALARHRPSVDGDAVARAWRALYPVACADFGRFLAGWAPWEWRREAHLGRMAREALRSLAGE